MRRQHRIGTDCDGSRAMGGTRSAGFCAVAVLVLGATVAVAQAPRPSGAASAAPKGPSQQSVPAVASQPTDAAGANAVEIETLLDRLRKSSQAEDVAASANALRRLADDGSPLASLWIGRLAASGILGKPDRGVAESYLRSAARAGLADAQFELAEHLLNEGPERSSPRRAEAITWLQRSATSLPESVYRLALLEADASADPASARRRVIRASAEAGYAQAQYDLATLQLSERPDAAKDADAIQWLERAVTQGHLRASYDLGVLLFDGVRTRQDSLRAARLIERGAVNGNPRAEYALGRAYMTGQGVSRDNRRALEWFRRAAAKRHAPAEYAVGFALTEGIGTPRDQAAALRWYERAAENGYGDAFYAIGNAYVNGYGVGVDEAEAYRWYCRGAQAGHEPSRKFVERRQEGCRL